MSRRLNVILISAAVLLALVLITGLVLANTRFARQETGEKDFLVPWLAARTFLQYGDSPYSTAATQRAQIVYYGRLAEEGEDPLRLWLPFPLLVLYLPLALIPDAALARGIWVTLLEIALIGLTWTGYKLSPWRAPRWLLLLLLLFGALHIHGLFSLFQDGWAVFSALAMATALLALRAGQEELAGGLLLFGLVQPVPAIPLSVFLIWWTLRQRRFRLLLGALMSAVLLLGLSMLFLSDWFIPFLGGALVQARVAPGLTLARLLGKLWPVVGPRLAWSLAGLLGFLLLLEWARTRDREAGHVHWTACLTLAVTPLLGFSLHPQDLLLQILPLYLILSIVDGRWTRHKGWSWTGTILSMYFILGWLGTQLLSAGQAELPLAVGLLFVPPILNVVALYWVRWWAVRAPRFWWDRQA